MQRIVLVDGMNVFYRAHFAHRYLETEDGRPTSILHGFPMIVGLLRRMYSCPVVVCFDGKATESEGKGWRFNYSSAYKAKRVKDKSEVERAYSQYGILFHLLRALGYPVISVPALEADDLIAIAATALKSYRVYIVSNDADFAQLASDSITVVRAESRKKGKYVEYDKRRWLQQYNLTSEKIIDFRSLVGDSSDNLTGAKGIGPVKALKILQLGYRGSKSPAEQPPQVRAMLTDKQLQDARETYLLSLLVKSYKSPRLSPGIRKRVRALLKEFWVSLEYDDMTLRRIAHAFELDAVLRMRYTISSDMGSKSMNLL